MSKRNHFVASLFVVVVSALSLLSYFLLNYHTERPQFLQLSLLFAVLFVGYFYLIRKEVTAKHFSLLLGAGIAFRLALVFGIPNLSDDVYRFIWDGKLSAAGLNPFNFFPSEIQLDAGIQGINHQLFDLLNSKGYYTIYPPVLQYVFWIGGVLFQSTSSVILFFKSILLLAEVFNFYFLVKLLKHFGKPVGAAFIYFLNPLVIIELNGNVHFEGLLFFFLLAAAVLLVKRKLFLSAVVFGLAISTKLLPVIFLPLVVSYLGWKKGILFSMISLLVTVALFAFWIDSTTIHNFLASVDLFFQHFEFNASIYYLVREIGLAVKGYNIIKWAGPALMMIASISIFIISFKKSKTQEGYFTKALLVCTILFLSATTVHPWYITLPLLVSVFTAFTFPLVWTWAATFSYLAYATNPVQENLWVVAICYAIVFGWAAVEWYFYGDAARASR